MKKVINNTIAKAELLNELYALGYRYITSGDYKVLTSTDPWSGMPNVDFKLFAFDNKEEAENFAKIQIDVFDSTKCAKVTEIPPHTKTWNEIFAEQEKVKAEKKAKREAKEIEEAKKLGLTLEEYKIEKKRKANIKKVEKEIAELEKEIAKKKDYLKKLKVF